MVNTDSLVEVFRKLLINSIEAQQVENKSHLTAARTGIDRAQETISTLVEEEYEHVDIVKESLRETLRRNISRAHDNELSIIYNDSLKDNLVISAANKDVLVLECDKPSLLALKIALSNIERVATSTIETPLNLGYARQVVLVQVSELDIA